MADDQYWLIAREVCTARQLEILTLRYKNDMTHRQIAYALGISKQTVGYTLDRATQLIELRLRGDAA